VSTSWLIRDVTVLDGVAAPRPHADVAIVDGLITGVGTALGQPPGARVVEGRGRTLLPGLIDMHGHLGSSAPPGETADWRLVRCARNARAALRGGVTTMREVGNRERVGQSVRDAIAAGMLAGPRLLTSGRMIAPTNYGRPLERVTADDARELRVAVRTLVEEGVDSIKISVSGGGSSRGSNVGRAHYSTQELEIVVAEAHRLGKRVAAHAIATEGIRSCVDAGVDTIEHCGWMGVDGRLEVDDGLIDRLAVQRITVVPTMAVWYRPGYDDLPSLSPDQRLMRAVREERTAVWRAMHERGVRFAAGPDAWEALAPEHALVREVELMVRTLGLAPLEAIRAATDRAAEALGLADAIGTIAAGKRADLVLCGGDPLARIEDLRRRDAVWQGGRLAVEDGRVVDP